jgi:hypothetical protein
MMMMKNMEYSRWVGNDDDEAHSRWVYNDDDDEEQEVLTMGW